MQKTQSINNKRIEDRICEIEAKLAFLEDNLQQVNDVVVLQQNKLEELDRAVQLVMGRVKDLLSTGAAQDMETASLDPASEKPPHY